VPAGVLTEVLREHEDGRAVFTLWKAAVEAGGLDNITIALVRPGTWNHPLPWQGERHRTPT
jgi:PPM family protein phosphatase